MGQTMKKDATKAFDPAQHERPGALERMEEATRLGSDMPPVGCADLRHLIARVRAAEDMEAGLQALKTGLASSAKTLTVVQEQISEGFHTGLRKACDGPEADRAWRAIQAMPAREWSNLMDFVLVGLGVPRAIAEARAAIASAQGPQS